MNKLAIAINSLDRPEYLKKCLSSLEKNLSLNKVDFYLYQDGGVNSCSCEQYVDGKTIQKCVDLFKKSKLPNRFVRQHKDNIGAGLQRLMIFGELFSKGYEYVVSVDNDLVFSKYYVRTLLTLFEQFRKNPSVGMIQTSLRSYLDVPLKSKKVLELEDQIQFTFSRRWEQGLWKRSWKKIWPKLKPLYDELKNYDFKQLLHEPNFGTIREKLLEKYGSFHVDESIEIAMIISGLKGVCTRLPRHRGVGIHGLYTFTPEKWEESGLDKIILPKVNNVKKFKVFRNKLCVAIRTLKRVERLKLLLSDIKKNYPRNVDFYFYIDGAINPFSGKRYAQDVDAFKCLRAIQVSPIPNKTIVFKHENNQTAIQKYEMLSTLFPQYEYVMMLDNDLNLNRHYIKTIKTLFKQFKDNKKAGILQTSYIRGKFEGDNRFEKHLRDKVQYGFAQRWEQGFWKQTWKDIKPYFEKYMEIVKDCDYKDLISGASYLANKRKQLSKIAPEPNTDLVLEFCAYRVGYLGLHTETLRYKGVGYDGMYSFTNEEFWKDRGFDKIIVKGFGGNIDRYKFRAKMQYAEDKKNLMSGKDIYIAGSGPSLDTYPDNFLDDKTGVTLHLAYLKFPDASYRGVCESPIIRYFLKSKPEFFDKKLICTNPFHPDIPVQYYLGNDLGASSGKPLPILVRYTKDESYLLGTDFRKLIRKAIKHEPVIAGAYSTVLHSILFAVLTMGARRINLIGIDHSKDGDKTYYSLAQQVELEKDNELRLPYKEEGRWYRSEMCERQKFGTGEFVDECAKHGIIIKRYKNYDDWKSQHE